MSYRPLDLGDVMPFGKYKDESIASLCDDDPEYLAWLTENTDTAFTDDVIEAMKIGLKARDE